MTKLTRLIIMMTTIISIIFTWIGLASCLAVSIRLVTHIARLQTYQGQLVTMVSFVSLMISRSLIMMKGAENYQEKSDRLPSGLCSSLRARPCCPAARVEEERRLQKRLDEHGKGGKQLEQVELRLEVGEEAGKGDQACLAAHTQLMGRKYENMCSCIPVMLLYLCCKKKETVQVNACTALRVPELSHLSPWLSDKKKDRDDFDRLHHQLHLAAGNDSGKGGNCVKPKLRSGR